MCLSAFLFVAEDLTGAKSKKYTFRIKTKNGNIVGGISIYGTDEENAKYKLRQRYPDCQIIEMKEG
jgi:hypothetical protein